MAAYVQTNITFDTNAGNKSASITPAVGGLLVVAFAEAGQAVTGSISDDRGGTYTTIISALRTASAAYLAVAIRNQLCASAVAHNVTMTAGGTNTGGGLAVFEFSGMQRVGVAAARQSAKHENIAALGTPAPALGVAALTVNALLAVCVNLTSPAGMTPPSGFTERQDVGFSTPTTGLEAATADNGITASTITWGSTTGTQAGAIVVELDTSPIQKFPTQFQPLPFIPRGRSM